ncbi:hypothetical protein G7Z17_g8406 [Cylindrodendrum hubeiense]|uniref:Uncharacterized protein n=1 Tax=Cylindrodendrum hubeiense TaxID=595255 RepID=A0A9P5LD76_9HYPO|nr:hypothetical protein G7Z17_g8406 [Cylindrodendrum hubeiense]
MFRRARDDRFVVGSSVVGALSIGHRWTHAPASALPGIHSSWALHCEGMMVNTRALGRDVSQARSRLSLGSPLPPQRARRVGGSSETDGLGDSKTGESSGDETMHAMGDNPKLACNQAAGARLMSPWAGLDPSGRRRRRRPMPAPMPTPAAASSSQQQQPAAAAVTAAAVVAAAEKQQKQHIPAQGDQPSREARSRGPGKALARPQKGPSRCPGKAHTTRCL